MSNCRHPSDARIEDVHTGDVICSKCGLVDPEPDYVPDSYAGPKSVSDDEDTFKWTSYRCDHSSSDSEDEEQNRKRQEREEAVSYTHLTLPTIYSV